jgi:CRP-like cAMP-binding protein
MSETIYLLHHIISNRLHEIESETGRLARALADMGEAPVRPEPRRRRDAGKRRARAKRGHRREQLLVALKAKPGSRPTELAEEIGVSAAQVSALLTKLRAEKLVGKKGRGYELKR